MKASIILTALLSSPLSAHGFSTFGTTSRHSTTLQMTEPSSSPNCVTSRRTFASQAAFFVGSGIVSVQPANAIFGSDTVYEPKFDDMKQIYFLGMSLNNLLKKVSDPNTMETALEGLISFNRDPNFYTGYAKNYISKSVKKRADEDPRVGYIKKASKLIASCLQLVEGSSSFDDKEASEEAVKRVKKAQALIGKFIAESGVEDEKLAAYVNEHPLD